MKVSQFLLPDLGEGLEEAQLVEWLVREGDVVRLNQPLCQVETAKALVDIPSPYAGRVSALHARPGETVAVGSPLISIARDEPAGNGAGMGSTATENAGPNLVGYGTEGPAQTFQRRRRTAQAAPGGAPAQPAAFAPSPVAAAPAAPPAQGADGGRASPLVRKMAAERGIDLAAIRGTGPGGRIRVEDLGAASARPAAPITTAPTLAADEERISTVGIRKAIAAKMVRAWTTIPHMTEYVQFDASALAALRGRLRASPEYAGARLTFLPFLVRALVLAVRDFPILNARWDEEGSAIVVKRGIHVGVATDTERGLIVPVIRDAQALGFAQIAAEAERLAQAARAGALDTRSMTGGTITLTNVGAAGPIDTGAPIINAPEVCCVGFGAIKPRPTVVGDRIEIRPGAWISMSCDHRVVDGATAARFLGRLVELLERPEALLGEEG